MWIWQFPAKTGDSGTDYVSSWFRALVVLRLLRGCAPSTSRVYNLFVLTEKFVFTYDSYLYLYISGLRVRGRANLSVKFASYL